MKLLADESVDRPIVERLRTDGHDVLYVGELESGISDIEVLQRANELSALLVTLDKDFGELVFQHSLSTSFGVVLIHLTGMPVERKAEIVSAAFQRHKRDFLGSFSVITSRRIRIRRNR